MNIFRPRLRSDEINSDYINASFVDVRREWEREERFRMNAIMTFPFPQGYKMKNAYIVTQGPLPNTVSSFWRMVWDFNSHSIVQLCNVEENGAEVCHKYWPDKGERNAYDQFYVTLQSETNSEHYVIRKFQINQVSIFSLILLLLYFPLSKG